MNCEYLLVFKRLNGEWERSPLPFHANTPEEADEFARQEISRRQGELASQLPAEFVEHVIGLKGELFRMFKEYDGADSAQPPLLPEEI